jgi:hypothetical protein
MNLLGMLAIPGTGSVIQNLAGQDASPSWVSGGSIVLTWIGAALALAMVATAVIVLLRSWLRERRTSRTRRKEIATHVAQIRARSTQPPQLPAAGSDD